MKIEIKSPQISTSFKTEKIYPKLEELKVIPSVEEQNYKGTYGEVTVQGVTADIDEDIKPENIKAGVNILGVSGGYEGIDTSDATATSEDIVAGKIAYANGKRVIGTIIDNGALEYTPSEEEQIIPAGKTSGGVIKAINSEEVIITPSTEEQIKEGLFNRVKVEGIKTQDLNIIPSTEEQNFTGLFKNVTVEPADGGLDTSDATATAADVLKDKIFYANGKKEVGTLEVSSSSDNATISPLEIGATTSLQISTIYKKIKQLPENLTLSGTDGSYMFGYCESLEEIPETLDTSNITKTTGMFIGCTSLKKIPLLDLSKVVSSLKMFNGCSSLKEIPLLNTSSITNMGYMFASCKSLEKVPLLNTSNNSGTKSTMQNMFSNCPNLTDESLNNILAMCINATKFYNGDFMKLSYIGLTSDQATRCQSLSNYQAFINAGWTTGF